MGVLRLLLALAVVVAHSGPLLPFSFVSASLAVTIFFAISGFYMAIVLNTKYSDTRRGNTLFWTNRLLRLYPAYWAVLVLTALVFIGSVVLGPASLRNTFALTIPWTNGSTLTSLQPIPLVFFAVSNATILAQDVANFTWIDVAGALRFMPNDGTGFPANRALIVPQAWSISIELLFYALAPFILRRRLGVLAAIVGASVVLRALMILGGWSEDPWSYRFAPTALAVFVLGSAVARVGIIDRIRTFPSWAEAAAGLFAGLLVAFNGTVGAIVDLVTPGYGYAIAGGVAFIVVVCALPLLFRFSQRHALDGFLGELSYPLYLIHLAVIQCVGIYASTYQVANVINRAGAPLLAPLALLLALAILLLIDRPVDALRQARATQRQLELRQPSGLPSVLHSPRADDRVLSADAGEARP